MITVTSTAETAAAKAAAADAEAREEAVEACALMASSNSEPLRRGVSTGENEEAFNFGDAVAAINSPAASLARAAYWHCAHALGEHTERECWAEAEALLREGWTP